MRIMVLGSGGREHALAWKLSQSPMCQALYVAPGNAGTSQIAENLDLNPLDFDQVGLSCLEHNVDTLIVGPEAPLAAGIADHFKIRDGLKHIRVVGPGIAGARLESSKQFAKEFMARHNIPTAAYKSFDRSTIEEGIQFIKNGQLPIVLKADGLAAGKGVLILNDYEQAVSEFESMLRGKFGDASSTVVIEEYLSGLEFSVFIYTDGKNYVLLPIAKDYKRIGEGDTGLNTGGMGAVSPVNFVDAALTDKLINRIIEPTLKGLEQEHIAYHGFIFFGLINVNGDPFVIEYNCRLGDPESEVVIPRITSDLCQMFEWGLDGKLSHYQIAITDHYCTTVMLVSGGYPEKYEKGKSISGLEKLEDGLIFHAGTKREDQSILTNGGRVIACSSMGMEMDDALDGSYKAAQSIQFEGKSFRSDIGFDLH